jgi:hypothetical protein
MKHGGCLHQYGRGSTRTVLRLLQQNKKNSVSLNELCIRSVQRALSRHQRRTSPALRRITRAFNATSDAFYRDCKNIDEIEVFCINEIARLPQRRNFFAATFIRFSIGIARGKDIFTGKNFFKNCIANGVRGPDSSKKRANQCRVIRGAYGYRASIFAFARAPNTFRFGKFHSGARKRGAPLPHCTQIARMRASRARSVRVRVSFSGFR